MTTTHAAPNSRAGRARAEHKRTIQMQTQRDEARAEVARLKRAIRAHRKAVMQDQFSGADEKPWGLVA